MNLEGRPQRLRRAVAPPAGWDELEFFARLAQRFGLEARPWAAPARRRARCPAAARGGRTGRATAGPARRAGSRATASRSSATGRSSPAPPSNASPSSSSSGRSPEVELPDAARHARSASAPATRVTRALERNVTRAQGAAQPPPADRRRAGRGRSRRRARRDGVDREGLTWIRRSLNQPWWIDVPKSLLIINIVMLVFAYMTLHRAQAARADAAALRPEPRRAVRAAPADRRPRQARAQGDLLSGERHRAPHRVLAR